MNLLTTTAGEQVEFDCIVPELMLADLKHLNYDFDKLQVLNEVGVFVAKF